MKTTIAVMLLMLTGCGIPDPLEFTRPVEGCLAPYFSVEGRVFNPAALAQNERILKGLFEHGWNDTVNDHPALLSSDEDFCAAFAGIHITYQKDYIPCDTSATGCLGLTDALNGIRLEDSGAVFLHELIHVYETEHGVLNSYQHPNWGAKGYYYLNNAIWTRARVSVWEQTAVY